MPETAVVAGALVGAAVGSVRAFLECLKPLVPVATKPKAHGIAGATPLADGGLVADAPGIGDQAAVACGADGLLLEVHPEPQTAISDGPQALSCGDFAHLVREMRPLAAAVGRTL